MIIYGPRRFDRLAGPPTTVSEQFSLPTDAVPPFTILVQNGDHDGSNRVSSATIALNSTEVFTQRDFNQNVATLTRQVSLISSNNIVVRLSSAPGSFLTITITSTRGSLASLSPDSGTQGQNLTVTLHGTNTRWIAGQTRAMFGAEVSVGGAAPGSLGPVDVIDSVTATAQLAISATASLAPRIVQVSTTIPAETTEELEVLIDGFKVVPSAPPGATSTTVSTLAGLAGSPGFVDGPSAQARFRDPAGLAVGPDDSVYVADAGNNRIRRIAPDGIVTTVAGDGNSGFADGPSALARFDNPQGVAVDASGMIYVADTGNNRIRRIAVDGNVSTLAGGLSGFQDGAGAQARFNAPRGVALDNQGNAYVADTGNSSVRAVSPSGNVSTVAGDGTIGSSDSPARFDGLVGITVEGSTLFVYVADTGNHRLRRVTPSGTTITLAGADRGFADTSSTQPRFAEPSGVAVDGSGKLVVADATNSLIRFVDPGSVGTPSAVSTIAGTGDRGLTDGAGTVARFFTPRGIVVGHSSAIYVADTGNHVLRRLLLPPSIVSFSPARANPGNSAIIVGERFDGRAPSANIVRFTRIGGGLTDAAVTFASRTQLVVTVPSDAATGPITVQTGGGVATSAASFEVITNTPIISDFNPKNGSVGTEITLVGTGLKADIGPTAVTFAGGNNFRLPALVTFVSPTSVRALVPNGAVTGVIDLTNSFGETSSATAFTVDPGNNDYQLTIAPSSTSAVQASSAAFVIFLTSPSTSFGQLVNLSATGLPSGATAHFAPQQITAGAVSTLSVKLSGTNPAPGSYSFTIRGSGVVDGSELVRTATATLSVIAGGQTTLSGRVLSTEGESIMGATVSLDGRTATTDAAGAFLLSGVTAGTDRPLMVDGRTASAPNRTYPLIIEPATIVAGEANSVPYTFYLPAIDTQYEVDVVPGQSTVVTNPRVPGLEMTIPADAHVMNRDGSPVTRVSITPLSIDRTPAPLPSNVGTNLVYTSQPGGAISNVAMPVVYPNLAGADPGTRIWLYAFNHDTVQWYVYGFGRVSADGRRIEPEIDPTTSRPHGLPDFSWHFPNATPSGNPSPPDSCPAARTAKTVDLGTGVKIEQMTDLSFGGARGGIALTRVYTSDLAQNCDNCPFGRGWTHNYAVRLIGSFQQGGAGRVVMPEQVSGRPFNYARTDPDGTLVFSTTGTVGQLGDVVRRLTNGTFEYRYANGNVMRFDSSGRLTALVDRNANTTALIYQGPNLTQITDPVGRSLTLDYDSSNRIIRATDPIGRTWRYTYEGTPGVAGAPGLTTVTDPLTHVMRYDYVTGGRLSKVTDKRGIVSKQITYDASGRVIRQRFADGGIEEYAYTLAGRVVTSATRTDALGRATSKRFNASGYVIETTDALGQSSQIERDLTTNLAISVRGPCGCAEVRRQFDERGNITASTDRLGQTERYEYEATFSNVTKLTDKLGRVMSFGYDARGNLISITNPLNQTTTFEYDQFGEITTTIDALGHSSHIEYDTHGNPVARLDELGNRWSFDHDGIGRPTGAVDPLARRASMTYDAMSRVLTKTDSATSVTSFEYDQNGNKISVTDALGNRWTTAHDAKNRPTAITDPLGRTARAEYAAGDELTAVFSPSGRVDRYTYDRRGQQMMITDPMNGVVSFTHDSRGNITSLKDQRGNTTTFTYDELNRPVATRDPLGRTSTVSYTAMDEVAEAFDRLGRRTSFSYDELNRPSRIIYADATVTYTFDPAGRLIRIDDTQSGFVQWSYDNANRIVSETTPNGNVTYTYNIAGQHSSMAAASRPVVDYAYDGAGRLSSIRQGPETFSFAYDALSRRVSLQRSNGVMTRYSYDELSRLSRLVHSNLQGQPVEDLAYTYDLEDEIKEITSQFSAQLLSSAKTAGPADAANRITGFGGLTLTFDSLGQTTSKSDGQGLASYEWDSRGRLTRATLSDGQQVSYSYDALGRRASRTASAVTTSFLYDRLNVVLDQQSDSGLIDYINGPGLDEKLMHSTASGQLYFLRDHLGSTAALVDVNGVVVERMLYEAFGRIPSPASTRFTYTGRELDELTGLMYYRSRWYDPQQGRFITEDPIGFHSGDPNLYSYARNDPLNFRDPRGLWPSRLGQDVHQEITERALAGRATTEEITILMNEQEDFDTATQAEDYANAHAMRKRGQSRAEARRNANRFIRSNICIARQLAAGGHRKQAMRYLSRAMHTLQDSTSPTHAGFAEAWEDTYPQVVDHAPHYVGEMFDPPEDSVADELTLMAWRYFTGEVPMPTDFFSDSYDYSWGRARLVHRTPAPDGGNCGCK